jgi:hypothetical protein
MPISPKPTSDPRRRESVLAHNFRDRSRPSLSRDCSKQLDCASLNRAEV